MSTRSLLPLISTSAVSKKIFCTVCQFLQQFIAAPCFYLSALMHCTCSAALRCSDSCASLYFIVKSAHSTPPRGLITSEICTCMHKRNCLPLLELKNPLVLFLPVLFLVDGAVPRIRESIHHHCLGGSLLLFRWCRNKQAALCTSC